MQAVEHTAPGVEGLTPMADLGFALRATGLRLRRALLERLTGTRPPQHARAEALATAPLRAEFSSHLWPREEVDRRLVAGKIQNLRQAAKALHGLEIRAGAVFGFWRQVGRPLRSRGYARGRELREGCLVPATGGGLCQLTNALYNAALRAGLEIVERHRHSRVLPGSLAESDRDATVFWNYVDLRLRSDAAWRLEVTLGADELHVRIRTRQAPAPATLPLAVARAGSNLGDCTTCDRHRCHRHVGAATLVERSTWLFAEPWPEFLALAAGHADDRRLHANPPSRLAPLRLLQAGLRRLRQMWPLARRTPLPEQRLQALQCEARRLAARLRPDDLHLVVDQGLLPFLWRDGELAGRRFDVLMTALPMHELQRQLDRAAQRHPHSRTLADFRADPALAAAEAAALASAGRWISPHAGILALAGDRGEALAWSSSPPPPRRPRTPGPPRLLFPASALARKGALELREALRGLPLQLLLPPGAGEDASFWQGIEHVRVANYAAGLELADAAVLPAWVEHRPRGLLAAIARGLPVVATAACGLSASAAWVEVEPGDVAGLRQALLAALGLSRDRAAAGRK